MDYRKKVILFICAAAIIVSAAPVFAASKFHIGVVTGTVSQGEDVIRGAEKLVEMYGDVSKGGMISTSPIQTTSCRKWRQPSPR